MGQELAVPQAFQGRGMSQAFAQAGLNATDDNLAEGIGQSYGTIRYKGKVWTIRYRGENKQVLRPDDGTPAAYLDVIILGQAKTKSKSYYKKYEPGQSDGERPLCSSIDGILPDADVTQKQCDTCALCPRNAWKMQPNGRKGRECTDYKRLAVLVLPTQTKPTFGTPIMEPMFLRVPPDSLNSLAIMGETMSGQGYHYSTYITRITFDPQKAHPCMMFRPIQPLSDQEAPVIIELTKDPLVGRITMGDSGSIGTDTVQQALAPAGTTATGLAAAVGSQVQSQQPQPAQQTQQPQPAPNPAPVPSSGGLVSQALAAAAPASQGSNGLGAALPATSPPSTPAGLTETANGLVNGASGGANTVLAGPAQSNLAAGHGTATEGAAISVADTGMAEASDDELDAQIAALIQPK